MRAFSSSDPFATRRLSFFANTLFLIGIMLLYMLAGALLFPLVNGSGKGFSLSHFDRNLLLSIRFLQAGGQILVLAMPVILHAAWHTGKKNPFSVESLAFLGIRRNVNVRAAGLAVGGIFLLQPLLYTLTAVQDLYLWPAFGAAGGEVAHQRDVMESFIRELALVRTVPEFVAVAFVLAVTPAFCEELLFRGYIQQNYRASMKSGWAVFLTGSVFAFFHMSAANLVPLALLGWYIGYIYSKTGNLGVPFFVHLLNNFVALLFLLFTAGGNLPGPVQPEFLLHAVWWWLVVGVSLLLFVMVVLRFSDDRFFNNG
ncbi:MAG: CPBP family intramembrane glutamic endopeptidase [Chlorobiaceae bacterium]|jgi:uncharacterized protein